MMGIVRIVRMRLGFWVRFRLRHVRLFRLIWLGFGFRNVRNVRNIWLNRFRFGFRMDRNMRNIRFNGLRFRFGNNHVRNVWLDRFWLGVRFGKNNIRNVWFNRLRLGMRLGKNNVRIIWLDWFMFRLWLQLAHEVSRIPIISWFTLALGMSAVIKGMIWASLALAIMLDVSLLADALTIFQGFVFGA